MKSILLILLFGFFFFLSCRDKDAIEGEKIVYINVIDSQTELPIDSVEFFINWSSSIAHYSVSTDLSDSNGNCKLIFDYEYSLLPQYSFEIRTYIDHYNSEEPIITYARNISTHEIYKVDGKIPTLDFANDTKFNVPIILIPVSELAIDYKSYGRTNQDTIYLTFTENDVKIREYVIKDNASYGDYLLYFPVIKLILKLIIK